MPFSTAFRDCRPALQHLWAQVFLRLGCLRPDQRGLSSVYFALATPIVLAVIMGTIDVSRMMMTQNTLIHAANEATLFAMVQSTSDHIASEDDIVSLVKERMTELSLDQAVVSVSWIPESEPTGRVTVNVDYPYNLSALGLGTVNLRSSSSVIITH